ncbi:hypothetical protein AB0368_02770 [Actinoplanes sp. NPDC051475]
MRIQEFVITGDAAGPYGITIGPDRAVWVTCTHSGEIGRLVRMLP